MIDLIGKSCADIFPKNKVPRPEQTNCIDLILNHLREKNKFIIIEAPTGVGKGHISAALAEIVDEPTEQFKRMVLNYDAFNQNNVDKIVSEPSSGLFALTTTKALQDQYLHDFDYAQVLKGQSNYQCEVDPDFTVDFAPCIITSKLKRECWNTNRCTYYKKRNDILVNKFSVLSYSMFFSLPDYIKKRNIIICDEASELEDELVKAFSVAVTYKHLDAVKIEYVRLEDEIKSKNWFTDLYDKVKIKNDEMVEEFSNRKDTSHKDTVKLKYVSQLCRALESVVSNWNHVEYVVEFDDKIVQAVPLKVDYLADNLFRYADHVILMSATIVDHKDFAHSLGVKNYKYIEVESSFDPKKSPIYCSDKYALSYNTMKQNLPRVIELVKPIIEHHKNEKGIIHTHTNIITEELKKRFNNNRFLYREDGSTNIDILNEHALRKDSTILVSPSMAFGVDLKDDAARWQIIMKIPYPSLGSKRIKKLAEINRKWYMRKTLTVFMQACGRSTRSKDDYSATYVLDASIVNIIQKHRDILPKYFLKRFQ